jgi:hypothetical protein
VGGVIVDTGAAGDFSYLPRFVTDTVIRYTVLLQAVVRAHVVYNVCITIRISSLLGMYPHAPDSLRNPSLSLPL